MRNPVLFFGVVGWLAFVAWAVATSHLPVWVSLLFAVVNVVVFVELFVDKQLAKANRRRIPEAHLHHLEFFGGVFGSFLAQRAFRHKTAKRIYQYQFALMLFGNFAALVAFCFFTFEKFPDGTPRVLLFLEPALAFPLARVLAWWIVVQLASSALKLANEWGYVTTEPQRNR